MTHYGEILGDAIVNYNESSANTLTSLYQQDNSAQHQYGEILESVDLKLDQMYDDFDDYFNHPVMVKIKDVNGYSMYMSKTYCLLSNECRYILVFIPQDNMPIRNKENLSTLRWVSLQTRTMTDHHDLPPHGYQPRRHPGLNFLIERDTVSTDCSTYNCKDLPITVTLLHGKNSAEDYQKKGNVIAALETFQTIITIKDTS